MRVRCQTACEPASGRAGGIRGGCEHPVGLDVGQVVNRGIEVVAERSPGGDGCVPKRRVRGELQRSHDGVQRALHPTLVRRRIDRRSVQLDGPSL